MSLDWDTRLTPEEQEQGQADYIASLLCERQTLVTDLGNGATLKRRKHIKSGYSPMCFGDVFLHRNKNTISFYADESASTYGIAFALSLKKARAGVVKHRAVRCGNPISDQEGAA